MSLNIHCLRKPYLLQCWMLAWAVWTLTQISNLLTDSQLQKAKTQEEEEEEEAKPALTQKKITVKKEPGVEGKAEVPCA